MKKTIAIVLIAFFFVIGCASKSHLSVNTPNADSNSEENIIDLSEVNKSSKCKCSTNTAIAIINGNHEEYRNYHNECVGSFFSNNPPTEKELTNWLSYAYIMAEIYDDDLAAYDFVQIVDDLKIENDQIDSNKIIKYLEMVSKSDCSDLSFDAARQLYYIYDEGKYGICRDKAKARHYDTLSVSISRTIKQ